eukprot:TRINITY_DN28206_c0_g1_i1.p1 TRINITY_DN28206_c0_g1~~TRINITY_DN28206_c0_g1_i1.p1  ORF type:complete len:265 (+),score=21.67 TRINITY_DN28206_c0_g1_i1:148-942(+)
MPDMRETSALVDARNNDLGSLSSRPTLLDGKPLSARVRWYPPPSRSHSRRELLADQFVNFCGAALSWPAMLSLVYIVWIRGSELALQCAFWGFGVGMVTMLNCSAFYHYCSWNHDRALVLRSFDHIGIDAMIMGAFAPACIYSGCFGVLMVTCSLGCLGVVIEVYELGPGNHTLSSCHAEGFQYFLCARYLLMGWSAVLAWSAFNEHLPAPMIRCAIAGGALYTVGVPFLLMTDTEFHMAIWHFFVLIATMFCYAGIICLVPSL